LILKRRDVRVVEGARLESDFGEHYQAAPVTLLCNRFNQFRRRDAS
jgi:hypothetical protein